MLVSVTCRAWQPISRISFHLILMNSCYNVMCQYTSSQISTEGWWKQNHKYRICRQYPHLHVSLIDTIDTRSWLEKYFLEVFLSSSYFLLFRGTRTILNLIPADKILVLAYCRPGLLLIIKGHLVKLTVWRTQLMDCERALKTFDHFRTSETTVLNVSTRELMNRNMGGSWDSYPRRVESNIMRIWEY